MRPAFALKSVPFDAIELIVNNAANKKVIRLRGRKKLRGTTRKYLDLASCRQAIKESDDHKKTISGRRGLFSSHNWGGFRK